MAGSAAEQAPLEATLASKLSPGPGGGRPRHAKGAARRAVKQLVAASSAGSSRAFWEALSEPQVQGGLNKLTFVFFVSMTLVTEMIALAQPGWLGIWYMATMTPLMACRYVLYSRTKEVYFMIDFCYFVNALCFYSLTAPGMHNIHKALFVLANGPIAIAIVAWENRLVFHSLDKCTSVYLHFFPALLSFVHRWWLSLPDYYGCTQESCSLTFYNGILLPMLLYGAWLVLYQLKTEVFDRHRLRADQDLVTSMRYLTQRPNFMQRLLSPVLLRCGLLKPGELMSPDNPAHKLLFIVVQSIYTLLTSLAATMLFSHRTTHQLYLLMLGFTALWNGADFYLARYGVLDKLKTEPHGKRGARNGASVAGASTGGSLSEPPGDVDGDHSD